MSIFFPSIHTVRSILTRQMSSNVFCTRVEDVEWNLLLWYCLDKCTHFNVTEQNCFGKESLRNWFCHKITLLHVFGGSQVKTWNDYDIFAELTFSSLKEQNLWAICSIHVHVSSFLTIWIKLNPRRDVYWLSLNQQLHENEK